jgi:ribonuclease HIII
MTPADIEANRLLQQFWRDGGGDDEIALQLRNAVLANPPSSALVAGRCLSVLDAVPKPGAWNARVTEFNQHAARLIRRCHQIDQLGDEDTTPETVFEILAEEVDGLEIDTFDRQALQQARIGRSSRAAAAEAFLSQLGWNVLPSHAAAELRAAIDELQERADRFHATALFEAPNGEGLALGITVAGSANNDVTGYSDADKTMNQQASGVLRHAYDGHGARWGVEWEVGFGGSSIGLALWIAAMVDKDKISSDPLLASTGRIDPVGAVSSVGGIPAKVKAAVAGGYRRILVPVENEDEARDIISDSVDVTILGVRNVEDLPKLLRGLSGAVPIGVDGTVRFVRKLLPLFHLDLVEERAIDHGHRLEVADAASRARIDVFRGRRGTVKPSGSGTALESVNRLVEERLPQSRLERRDTLSVLVPTPSRQERLTQMLEREGAQSVPVTSPYEQWRYRLSDGPSQVVVVGYKSGRVVVSNGQAPAHDTATTILRKVLDDLGGFPSIDAINPSALSADDNIAHIGTDEAGKGDYFGPLVCAACYLDPQVADILRSLGVKDSKALSDKTIRRLAGEIRSRLGGRFSVVTIQPKRFNSLYDELRGEGKNLNALVAWGHSRGIKDLVVEHKIDVEYAVIDKFADERYMRERLASDSRTRDLRLDQRTKAESDIAVAAASILARDAFVTWLEDQSVKLGMPLPKGAGEPVIAAARRLVAERGKSALAEVAKLSFKTTQKVLEAVP